MTLSVLEDKIEFVLRKHSITEKANTDNTITIVTNTQQAFSLLGIEEKRKKIKLIDKHTTPELEVWRACLT